MLITLTGCVVLYGKCEGTFKLFFYFIFFKFQLPISFSTIMYFCCCWRDFGSPFIIQAIIKDAQKTTSSLIMMMEHGCHQTPTNKKITLKMYSYSSTFNKISPFSLLQVELSYCQAIFSMVGFTVVFLLLSLQKHKTK